MNTRRIFCGWIVVILLACCVLPVFAAGNYFYVSDDSGVLTNEQNGLLEQLAGQVSRQHQFGVYIVTVDNFQISGNSHLRDYGENLFRNRSLGFGENKEGMMLILSTSARDYSIVFPSGEYRRIFTEYGLDRMEESIVSYLRNDDYYGAFREFISLCDTYLTAYENGEPIDEGNEIGIIAGVVSGGVAALLVGLGMSAPMHSAGLKHNANQYVAAGGLELHRRSDMFLHRSVTRVPRQTQSSSGSHSTTHHSSGGFSSRSGKY